MIRNINQKLINYNYRVLDWGIGEMSALSIKSLAVYYTIYPICWAIVPDSGERPNPE